MKRTLMILAAGFGLCHAGAALMPIEWSADGSDPKPFVASIAQGETRDLEVTLKNYGQAVILPDTATAELHYQTNGMGRSWWSGGAASVTTSGVVKATWTPAFDCGASTYIFAIGVVDGTNKLYTAYGLIRMRVSPGWVPNELAQPWRTLDFDTLTIQHPPWATTNDIDAAIAAILEDDPVALPVAQAAYTAASNAQTAAAAKVPLTRTVNGKALSANITLSPTDIGAVPMVDNVGVAPSFQAGGGMLTGSSYLRPYALTIGDGHADFAERINIDDVGITMPSYFRLLWPTTNNYLSPSPIATINDIDDALSAVVTDEDDPLSLHTDGGVMTGPVFIGPDNYIQLGTSSYIEVFDPAAIVGDAWYFRDPNVSETVVFEFAATSDLGKFADIASNVVYHIVVSNGHWLVQEVQ